MRCATRISERIGDTEIDHLSGRAEVHHAYLVYVTESKRWSPAVRGRARRYDPFFSCTYTPAPAREKSLNFSPLGNQKWVIGPLFAATLSDCRSMPEVSEPVGESSV